MQQKGARYVRVRALWLAAALAAAFWARDLIWQAVVQLFFGMLVALAALPVMKRLEKRFPPGASATLSITSLSALLIASLLLLAPALITQGRQLIAMLPAMYNAACLLYTSEHRAVRDRASKAGVTGARGQPH